jgi:hypothetical protein
MMKKSKLSATTPVGTFTRTTATPYAFVGVYRHSTSDGQGGPAKAWTPIARWSKTAAGADRLAREYVGDRGLGYSIIEFVGVYPVDVPAGA